MRPPQEPLVHLPLLVRFALVLAIFLLIPPLCRRVRVPPGVGLLLAGVALGPSGLGTLPNAAPVAEFFAEIGKLLLMFFAGLEIDLSQFRRTGGRSLVFGFLTFSIPQVVGTGVGMMAGYGWLAAVLKMRRRRRSRGQTRQFEASPSRRTAKPSGPAPRTAACRHGTWRRGRCWPR
jgi:hypothetical protein